jgi:hypothetical protein
MRLKRAPGSPHGGELIKDHINHCMEETSEAMPKEFKAPI